MRFTFALIAMTVSGALAAVLPRDADVTVGVGATITIDDLFSCKCHNDINGDNGVHINQDATTYQCAYAGGACQWNGFTGALINTKQTNCKKFEPCNILF